MKKYIFLQFCKEDPVHLRRVFLLGRIIKIFISSNLQRRPRIFKEFFMLGRMIKIYFFSILQRRLRIFNEFFSSLVEYNNNIYLFKSAKKTQCILRSFFLLGRIIKIFISSNLQRRSWIFKEFFFMLGVMIKKIIS